MRELLNIFFMKLHWQFFFLFIGLSISCRNVVIANFTNYILAVTNIDNKSGILYKFLVVKST